MNPQQAQKMQDEIFRRMTTDEKLEFAAQLWFLGRELHYEKTVCHPPTRVSSCATSPKF